MLSFLASVMALLDVLLFIVIATVLTSVPLSFTPTVKTTSVLDWELNGSIFMNVISGGFASSAIILLAVFELLALSTAVTLAVYLPSASSDGL